MAGTSTPTRRPEPPAEQPAGEDRARILEEGGIPLVPENKVPEARAERELAERAQEE